MRQPWADIDVPDILRFGMPVEEGLELCAIVMQYVIECRAAGGINGQQSRSNLSALWQLDSQPDCLRAQNGCDRRVWD